MDPERRVADVALLRTEWSTDDPKLAKMLRQIAALDEWSEERLALEAALHTWQAQHCYRRMGEQRGWRRADETAKGRRRTTVVKTTEAL